MKTSASCGAPRSRCIYKRRWIRGGVVNVCYIGARARIEPAAVTKIKTTKINSGAFCPRITKFNSPQNYPLYGNTLNSKTLSSSSTHHLRVQSVKLILLAYYVTYFPYEMAATRRMHEFLPVGETVTTYLQWRSSEAGLCPPPVILTVFNYSVHT